MIESVLRTRDKLHRATTADVEPYILHHTGSSFPKCQDESCCDEGVGRHWRYEPYVQYPLGMVSFATGPRYELAHTETLAMLIMSFRRFLVDQNVTSILSGKGRNARFDNERCATFISETIIPKRYTPSTFPLFMACQDMSHARK